MTYYEEIYAGKHQGNIDWTKVRNIDIVDIVLDSVATIDDLFNLFSVMGGSSRFEELDKNREVMDKIYEVVS